MLELELVCGLAVLLMVFWVVDDELPEADAADDPALVDEGELPIVVLETMVRTPLLVARLYTPSARLNVPVDPMGSPPELTA